MVMESLYDINEDFTDEQKEQFAFDLPEDDFLNEEQEEKKPEDWRNTGKAELFPDHLERELQRIKPPSSIRGNRAEMERARGQWTQLCGDISRVLRKDYDGVLNVDDIDAKRQHIERYIEELDNALDGITEMMRKRKQMKRRRRAEDEGEGLVKEAGTATLGVFITPFERAIVGALINGVVSGGRNIEELYTEAKKKYDITPREELSVFQILSDMGYANFRDRLRLGDNEDVSRTEGFGEWSSTYFA